MKSKVLEYKGYVGSVDFSLEDDVLHGKLLFIDDLVNYEAPNLVELRQAFTEAVDFYLDSCAEAGLEANKPCSGSFNVRIPQEAHKHAQIEAARRGLSLNDFVRRAIENELAGNRRITINHYESKVVATVHFEETDDYTAVPRWNNEDENRVKH